MKGRILLQHSTETGTRDESSQWRFCNNHFFENLLHLHLRAEAPCLDSPKAGPVIACTFPEKSQSRFGESSSLTGGIPARLPAFRHLPQN